MSQEQLKNYLRGTLVELEKLNTSLRGTQEIARENEIYFLLRELIAEQIGNEESENTLSSAHPTR